jgi:Zn-dependent alcohol dehydrogenase
VELYGAGKLPLEKLISRIYDLHEINQALTDLEDGKAGRPLVGVSREAG